MQSMLRYAVVRKGAVFTAWQAACIHELESSGLARLSCIVACDSVPRDSAYERFRASLHLPSQAAVDGCYEGVPVIDVDEAAQRDYDFIVSFASNDEVADLIDATEYGVWSFAYGDPERFTSSAPAFWEIYHNHGVTCAMLLKLERSDYTGIVLKRGYLPTMRDSYRQNVELLFSELAKWPALVCRDIVAGSATYFDGDAMSTPYLELGIPSRLQIAGLRAIELKNAMARYLRINFLSIDWNVFALKGKAADFIGRDAPAEIANLCDFTKGRYLADPCAVARNGSTYVFCEEYSAQEERGRIVAFELNGGTCTPARVAIEEPYHLSFPQIVEHGGETYCIAESAAACNVSLYRAIEFPYRWTFVQTLLDNVRAVDSSIVRFNGKWWLFCTTGKGPRQGDLSHLHIWYADDLFGPWKPHAANPVKVDVRCSRPAGAFFEYEGVLYRPAQDCSRTYGGAACINRIDKLTEFEFQETVVGHIRPPAGAFRHGLHTITCAGDRWIVDAKRYLFRPSGFVTLCKDAVKALLSSIRIWRSART
jgi:hypothetical protein